MIIVLLMILTVVTSSVSSFRPQPLEQVMRDTLKHVMRCPEWPTDEDIQLPIAAFSPARYMQLVATVRKDSRENSCGRTTLLKFNLQDPDSWNFCAMGICSEQFCSCFKNFVGKKCNKFEGNCWLFYCRLLGCNRKAPTLYCSCNPALYGTQVARGIYLYDHGFESSYIPPPDGFITSAFVDSHLIRQIGPEQYEIIGGNYYKDSKEIRAPNMRYNEVKYRYSLPRLKFNKPEQQFSENNPNVKYIQNSFYRKYPAAELDRNIVVPDSSRQLQFRNVPYSTNNIFYNAKSYKSNREIRDMVNSEERRPFASVLENGYVKTFNSPSNRDISYIVPRRTDRAQRTRIQGYPKNYLRNNDDLGFQYSSNNMFNKWTRNKNKLSYLPKRGTGVDPLNNDDWYGRSNGFSKEFVYSNGERGLFSDGSVYRVNREKILEENTIQETADDDNTYDGADDSEDLKFSSGFQNRFPDLYTVLYVIIIRIIFCFL